MNAKVASEIESVYAHWAASRAEWEKFATDEREATLINAAARLATNDVEITPTHFDLAFRNLRSGTEGWGVKPMPKVTLTKSDFDFFSSLSRDELIVALTEAGTKSVLYSKYRKACRDHGFQPVEIMPPQGFTDQELNEFAALISTMTPAECKSRYNDPNDRFKEFHDALEQRAAYLRDKPVVLTSAQYRALPPHTIASKWESDPKFRAAVEKLKKDHQI